MLTSAVEIIKELRREDILGPSVGPVDMADCQLVQNFVLEHLLTE